MTRIGLLFWRIRRDFECGDLTGAADAISERLAVRSGGVNRVPIGLDVIDHTESLQTIPPLSLAVWSWSLPYALRLHILPAF